MKHLLPLILVAGAPFATAAEKPKPLAIGSDAPDFSLPATDGKTYSLRSFKHADVLAILFTCNHCPTAQAYEQRIKKIVTDYRDKSFALLAISPNDPLSIRLDELGYSIAGDTLEDMKTHAGAYGFNFPYLYDGETQKTSLDYGVLATPHIYILDRDRKLRYQGRIDDDEPGTDIQSHDARNAIDALLAGTKIPNETTRVFGCSTKWADKRSAVTRDNEAWDKRPVTLETIDLAGVKALAANKTEKLRLINLWATWCGPCIAELPDLVEINRTYQRRDLELITISLDAPTARDAALKILKRNHAAETEAIAESLKEERRTTNNYLFDNTDKDALAGALDSEWPGPIPYTILIAPGGKIIYRHSGTLDPIELKKAIIKQVGRTY